VGRVSEGPWYRSGKNSWYANVDGRQIALGVRGETNRREALTAWHKLIAAPVSVRELVEQFLADAAARLKPNTVRIYRYDLGTLTERIGNVPAAKVAPVQLANWLRGLGVAPTTQGMMLRSAGACFGWAVRAGLLTDNPVRRVPKPRSSTRSESALISPETHAKLLAAATPEFGLVLRILYATGARPSEVCGITTAVFDPDSGVVKLRVHKSDHTGKPRLLFLPAALASEIKALSERYKTGPLLRSRKGVAWTGRSITQAMRRACRTAGVKAIAYGYRHTFATDGLANGIPEAHVAGLLGHSSTAMLHRHYSHLTSQANVLRNAAALVRPADDREERAAG
jgi:integrase